MDMDIPALNAWMDRHFTARAFRLETLQTYEVASDGSDFRRYLDGEPTWTRERKEPWLATLRAEHESGRYRHRVRMITHPVTPYTRYACEWGYAPNSAAGEDIRILDLGERQIPDVGEVGRYDWWLATSTAGVHRVAIMRYAADGQFLVAVEETDPAEVARYVAARDALWAAAEPFGPWWDRHPEHHRDGARVA